MTVLLLLRKIFDFTFTVLNYYLELLLYFEFRPER